jgi:hypothetical protein
LLSLMPLARTPKKTAVSRSGKARRKRNKNGKGVITRAVLSLSVDRLKL